MARLHAGSDKIANSGIAFIRMLRQRANEMPMQQADVLLTIARYPGMTISELSKETNLAQSSCSRNVSALSKFHRLGKEGLNLVESIPDPKEPRRYLLFLTPEGREFVKTLLGALDSEFVYDKATDARDEVANIHARTKAKRVANDKNTVPRTRIRPGRVKLPK